MSTLVEGPRHPARPFTPDTFADVTDATFVLCADGIEFEADLTEQQRAAVWDRMTSRDDADQAARANIATLAAALTEADLPAELEPIRSLAIAMADYTLGV